jgi:hypothetical protein
MSPFRPLTLPPSDTRQLQQVAKTILEANLDRYQRFLDVDDGVVDPRAWKLAKTKDQVCIYLERQRRRNFSPFQSTPAADMPALQSMMCVGSIHRTLEDVMFGIVNPTLGDAVSSTNDLRRAAVLSMLKAPRASSSFRSVTVKWTEMDVRLKSVGLVKNHDYVYVEATGTKQLPNGERVGYQLLHSVELPETPVLHERVRGLLSVCSFFRKADNGSTSIYTMGMMDLMGDRAKRVIVPHVMKALLSTFTEANCEKPRSLSQTLGKRYTVLKSLKPSNVDNACVVCSKRVWQLGKHSNTCNICSGHVCTACKVVKKLNFMTPELKITQRKVIFCSPCEADEDVSEFSFAGDSKSTEPRRKLFWRSKSGRKTLEAS